MKKELLNVRDVFDSEKHWTKEFNRIVQYFRDNIGKEECFYKNLDLELDDGAKINIDYNTWFYNLAIMYPFIRLKEKIRLDMFEDTYCLTDSDISRYINTWFVRPYRNKPKVIDIRELSTLLARIIENLKIVVEEFGDIIGVTYNYYALDQLRQKVPELNEILYADLDESLQPKEIEDYADNLLKRLIKILSKSDTGFAPLINSKAGVKFDQLRELLAMIGNKPDLDGNTLPVSIDTNIMIKGLNKPSNYVLDAKGGRKALIMNKKYTGNSGYFSRKLNLLAMDINISKTVDDCGTSRLIEAYIENEKMLKTYEGKWYSKHRNGKFLRCVQHDDFKLIGQTIYVRNAVTCKCKDGICKRCYGEMYHVNPDLVLQSGIISAANISGKFTNNILKSKHLLMCNSTAIEFEDLPNYLVIDGTTIILDNTLIPEDEEIFLAFYKDDMSVDLDEYADSTNITNSDEYESVDALCVERFEIVNADGELLHEVKIKNNLQLNIMNDLYELIAKYAKGKMSLVPIEKIEEESVLFTIDVNNAELNKTLNQVKNLLEKEDHLGYANVDDLVYHFNRLLIEGKIITNVVHAEILCKNLFRKANDILDPHVDFENDEPYVVLTLMKAIMNDASPIKSLVFERLKEQIRGTLLFRKTGCSMYDALFERKYADFFEISQEEAIRIKTERRMNLKRCK